MRRSMVGWGWYCWIYFAGALCYTIEASSVQKHVGIVADPCLGQCKDTHVYDMHTVLGSDAAEHSGEFLRPLHTILVTSINEREVASKLDAACKYNKAHHQCLASCKDTPGSRALIIGLKPWSFICRNWKFGELRNSISCLRKHATVLDRTCIVQLENLKSVFSSIWDATKNIADQLGPMCRAAKSYDLCYGDAVGYYCGQSAVSFWQALSDVTNATILELLSMSDRFLIPDQCKNKWYDVSLPPVMANNASVMVSAQRQLSSRSSGADLTVEKLWGKGANGVKCMAHSGTIIFIVLVTIVVAGIGQN